MSPPVADKAPEILRSIKPWAAPAVNSIVRTTKCFLYLCNEEGGGERHRWAFFSSLLMNGPTNGLGVFQRLAEPPLENCAGNSATFRSGQTVIFLSTG